MSRRDQITMTADELRAFLGEERVVTCASLGADGWPHLVPLWFVTRDHRVWAWTYGSSQKVRNLERDPRASLQVEAGETYDQLRGVLLRTTAVVHREPRVVENLGADIFERYHGIVTAETMSIVRNQARKRVGLEFVPDGEPATWDHRKLARGTY